MLKKVIPLGDYSQDSFSLTCVECVLVDETVKQLSKRRTF